MDSYGTGQEGERRAALEGLVARSGMFSALEAAKLEAWDRQGQVTLRQSLIGSMLTYERETGRTLGQEDVNSWCRGALSRHGSLERKPFAKAERDALV